MENKHHDNHENHCRKGAIALPGAILMVNNDLSDVTQQRLMAQLSISEAILGEEFDVRYAGNPEYPKAIRVLRQRLMVIRSFQDKTNAHEMDVLCYVKNDLISVCRNCFGPPGSTKPIKNITWGDFCIYNTDLHRSCKCACGGDSWNFCNDGYESCGGKILYYPATFDPKHPKENHWYNQPWMGCCWGCGRCCRDFHGGEEFCLCDKYKYKAGEKHGHGVEGCREVWDSHIVSRGPDWINRF